MAVKFYQVGGCVRDRVLGRKCNDIDYSVEAQSYEAMYREIVERGGEVFLESPEFLTIRAKVPVMGACDFVLCRKEGEYSDGRHPDKVEMGTIYDDLARRDFTMNAIAMDEDGECTDPHAGLDDIQRCVIRCVGDPRKRFKEDSLRLLRALRFAITLQFRLHYSVVECMEDYDVVAGLRGVSVERIREELLKAFKVDTPTTLAYLEQFSEIKHAAFNRDNGLWLMPTLRGAK